MRPATESELAQMIGQATQPLRIVGGGTRSIGQAGGAALEIGGLSRISLYEPGALTIVAGAGTPLAEVESALAAEGQRLPFEVPDMRGLLRREGVSTIGGVVAANASGPRRVQAGACRDSLIGVRFVNGAGEVIKNGGRVMKNVTGYDLVKLMAGSHGTLGVLSEVAFKVLPVPEAVETLAIAPLKNTEAIAALSAALGSPYEVSAAAHLPGQGSYLRIEGFAASVAYRAERLTALLQRFGEVAPDSKVERWQAIRDVAPFHAAQGDVWRVMLKPSDAAEIAARMGAEAVYFDWGGALIWALLAPGTDLRARLGNFAGHATRVRSHAPGQDLIPAFAPEAPVVARLTAGLRAQFDPRGILNSGLMG